MGPLLSGRSAEEGVPDLFVLQDGHRVQSSKVGTGVWFS
jgi:hypothetical protein